jgi:hypothetical protein
MEERIKMIAIIDMAGIQRMNCCRFFIVFF